jgi:hypothetical protein
LAYGAWSAVAATSGAQEWLRPRGVSAPRGTVPSRRSDSGDLRGAGVAPATHVGGQRRAPTGRMPGESPATAMHWLELAPHVWRLRGRNSGDKDVLEVQFVSMTVEDNSLTSLDYFSSPNSPNNFLGGLCFRPETRPPPRLREGECPRSPLRTLLPGQREELVPAHPTWDVLLRRTRCPSGRRVGVRG